MIFLSVFRLLILKMHVGTETVRALIRLLLQEQAGLVLHCLHEFILFLTFMSEISGQPICTPSQCLLHIVMHWYSSEKKMRILHGECRLWHDGNTDYRLTGFLWNVQSWLNFHWNFFIELDILFSKQTVYFTFLLNCTPLYPFQGPFPALKWHFGYFKLAPVFWCHAVSSNESIYTNIKSWVDPW